MSNETNDSSLEESSSSLPGQTEASERVENPSSLPVEDEECASDDPPAQKGKETLHESLRILEAVLFASDDLLTVDKLKAILPGQPDARKIRQMTDSINQQLQKQRHPFEIVEMGGGYQFRTVSYYYPWVQQLFKEKSAKKLSIQSLECLAIIAYKQPITKAEIEAIRGVISDGAMKTLLEKHLVTVAGRSEKAGRPLLYATSKEFLTYFGLNKIADLPRIEEFESLAKEKLGELSEAELVHIETEKAKDEPSEPQCIEPPAEATIEGNEPENNNTNVEATMPETDQP
jgi:segregation and condensation protein B